MIERKDLSDSEKLLIMVLQALSEQHGYCFATNAKLAKLLSWGVDKLRNNLRTLREKGIVADELEDGNRRRITLPQGGVQFHTQGGVQNDTGGCVDSHRGVCETAQGGVQNDTPLHNRTSNRTSNRTFNREAQQVADALTFDSDGNELEQPTTNQPEGQKEKVAPKRKRFEPPTEQEVELFFQTTASPQSWETFYNYYLANGWRVGRNPMKDWKAAARGWVSREKQYNKPSNNGKRQPVTEELMRDIANDIANGGWNFAEGA